MPGALDGAVGSGWPLILTTTALAFALVGLVRRYAIHSGLLDVPGQRSSHIHVTPTGGGAGLVGAMMLVTFVPSPWWHFPPAWQLAVGGLGVLAFIGWMDDRHDVSWKLRLLVQFLVSLILLGYFAMTAPGGMSGAPFGTWVMVGAGVPGLIWMMNTWNFMDGSDGMAGAQGVFCGTVLAVLFLSTGQHDVAQAAFALSAACLGFLSWNLPPARIFMGDTGSVPVGLATGLLLWAGIAGGQLSLPVALLVPATFFVDAGLTLAVRVARGERWYTPHRNHLYQMLIRYGWSHGRVMRCYQGVNLLILVPAIVMAKKNPDVAWPLAGSCVMLMMLAWAVLTARLGGVRE